MNSATDVIVADIAASQNESGYKTQYNEGFIVL